MTRKLKKLIPLLVLIIISFIVWSFELHHYFNFNTLRKHEAFLRSFIQQHLFLSLIIYSAIYIAVVALSIPGATFMTITGGFLFGQMIGTMAVVASATFGAVLLFFSVRLASEVLLSQKTGSWVQKMQQGFQENDFFYLLTLRLIPLFPFVAVNLAAAFLQVPLKTFFFATLIGIIPGSFVYVSIGTALQDLVQQPDLSIDLVLSPKILIALIGLGVLSLLPVVYKTIQNRKSRASH